MAVKTSEMITVRTHLALGLEAGLDHYLDEIADRYDQFLAPVVQEGETPLDTRFQIVLLRRSVAWHRQRLENLDDGVVDQSGEDVMVSAEIQKRTTAMGEKIGRVRDACSGVFGPESLARAGLRGELPRSPVRLYRRARLIHRSLRNPETGLEPLLDLTVGEEALTPTTLADQLEPELGELGQFVDARHQGNRKSTDVRSRRRQTIAEFDSAIRGIVRIAQGMFRLAGRTDLAERFRPILQRTLRRLDRAKAKEQAEADQGNAPKAKPSEETPTEETPAESQETSESSESSQETETP